MERIARVAAYLGWPCAEPRDLEPEVPRQRLPAAECRCATRETLYRLLGGLRDLLLWDSALNSAALLLAFNLLFWGFVVLEVHGFVAASSAALVIVLVYSTLEIQVESTTNTQMSQAKYEQVEKFVKKAELTFESLMRLQEEHPRAFYTSVFSASFGFWIVGDILDSDLFTYAVCMSILIGPAILLRSPTKELFSKEWDSEIEEFLPTVTEDNLQVLTRAGDTGDRSPTPPSPYMDSPSDNLDDDLLGLRMPSHEDGSTDGLELSELELSSGETDTDGVRFRSSHFERGSSSSDDDVELALKSSKFHEGDSDDSEFEIIDTREVVSLKNV